MLFSDICQGLPVPAIQLIVHYVRGINTLKTGFQDSSWFLGWFLYKKDCCVRTCYGLTYMTYICFWLNDYGSLLSGIILGRRRIILITINCLINLSKLISKI